MKSGFALILSSFVVSTAGFARAQPAESPGSVSATSQPDAAPARRTLTAVRMSAEESIVVDGRLDDAVWARATPATDFIQFDPLNGSPATERTEVRIVYHGTSLYMGVTCFDSEPAHLLRFQRRRDEGLPSDDRFMWVIDPFLTGQNGYFFETNPSGLMGDSLLSPSGQNREWDGIWLLRVQRTDIGWTLEIEIPFNTLNFDPNGAAWGINFQRTVRRRNEESLWNGWARNQGLQRLSNAGLVLGMNDNVSQGIGLDIRPYGVATSRALPGLGKPETDNTGKAGLDLFYNFTPGLRANFTLNTDFAQTEVDQRLVNLTQYPLFFPEKRTFFLEGQNLFDFAIVPALSGGGGGGFRRPVDTSLLPFFSRRIGLVDGKPQPVNYGVKLIGQAGRQDVGLLHVRTGDQDDVTGEDFSIVRVKRRLLRQSYVGALYTRRDAHASNADARQTMGVDFLLATSQFRGSQQLFLGGYFLQATNPQKTGQNAAYSVRMDYPNDRWNAGMLYRGVQARFEPAMGFTQRNNYQLYNPYLNFSPRPANNTLIRRLGFTGDDSLQTDMDNQPLSRIWNLTVFNADLHSQDIVHFLVIPEYERLDRPFNLGRGVILPIGGEYSFLRYRFTARTAERRLVSISPTIEWGTFYSGTRQQVATNIAVRVRPGIILYLAHEWNRIDLPEGRLRTQVYEATPELQFSQWISLVNTFQFDTVSSVLGWQSRFRWILKPGNDLFVVYSQNWLDDLSVNRFSTISRQAASKAQYTLRF
jgi:hypothetical protein